MKPYRVRAWPPISGPARPVLFERDYNDLGQARRAYKRLAAEGKAVGLYQRTPAPHGLGARLTLICSTQESENLVQSLGPLLRKMGLSPSEQSTAVPGGTFASTPKGLRILRSDADTPER